MIPVRKIWLPLLLVFTLVSIVYILFSRSTLEASEPLFEHLQKTFSNIPTPQQSELIYQHYSGCRKCRYAGMMAVYATDMSPEEVQSFYRNFAQNSDWNYDGEWVAEDNGRPIQWIVNGDWPFKESDTQIQSFTIFIEQSKELSTQGLPIRQAFEQAKKSGETVFTVAIHYTQDKHIKERECPPGIAGSCANDWWEIDIPSVTP